MWNASFKNTFIYLFLKSIKEKDATENNNVVYYGPTASCVEISKLCYTLNGYYLVNGKNQTKKTQQSWGTWFSI